MTTNKQEALGCATHHDEPMLFPSKVEAAAYCESGEEPIALILLSDYEALQAECEKLRKDAERYRWLRDQEARDNAICVLDCGEWVKPAMVIALAYSSAEQCDAAIDAAIQEDNPCQT